MPALRRFLDWTLYRLALAVLAPVLPVRLVWRARREPGYRAHWGERLGQVDARPGAVWLHAVSVGEMRAAAPLVHAWRQAEPHAHWLITCMTPAGRATAQALYGGFAEIAYLPYDYRLCVRRFLTRARPRLGLVMETELWPNLVAESVRLEIPLVLVNARLSARSARGYARLPALTRAALGAFAGVAAQTEADAGRLRALGAGRVTVTGNLKFDVVPPDAQIETGRVWRRGFGARPVWVCASTREGEEARILPVFARLAPPEVLLILVPRHPDRSPAVLREIETAGLTALRRSETAAVPAGVRVWLGDSLGELFAYYAAADVAFVGGSLEPLGGQNLIEPLALGVPVLVGPHMFNFAAATRDALAAGAAEQVSDAEALVRAALSLLEDAPRRRVMGEAGQAFAAAHRGATRRTLDALSGWLDGGVPCVAQAR